MKQLTQHFAGILTGFALAFTAASAYANNSNASENSSAALPKLPITVFQAPSQSVWIPSLIQKLELDRKHGFELVVTPKTSKVAYTDFATGKDDVCFCAAIAAVSRFKQQGAPITLLWNIFNFESDLVVKAGTITNLDQLEGKTLLADTITGSWALSKWFLQARGLDFSKVTIKSSSVRGAGALAELQLDRVDALVVNPIEAAAAVVQGKGAYTSLGLFDQAVWKTVSDTDFVPSIALGVQESWIANPANQELARRFYQANIEAVDFIRNHPHEAAALVAAEARLEPEVMAEVLIRYKDLMNLAPLNQLRDTVALLTQKLLPEGGQLPRPLTDAELASFISSFDPAS